MIVSCPNCETRFNIDPSVLLPNGRNLRCSRCRHVWLEPPVRATSSFAEPDADLDDGMPVLAARGALGDGAAPARGRGAAITGWVAMALILAVVVGGGIFAKERIVATWPPAAKLYDMIGLPVADPGYGLEPRNVASAQEMDGDVPVLVVSGEVVNTSGETRAVPRLRGALLDVREREIFFWVFATANATLAAGEVTPFSTRVPNPPTNARRIAGTFVKAE